MDVQDMDAIETFLKSGDQEEDTATIYELVADAIGPRIQGKLKAWHARRQTITEELEGLVTTARWDEEGDQARHFGDEDQGLDVAAWCIWRWVKLLGITLDESQQ